jgi:hypothetical protein
MNRTSDNNKRQLIRFKCRVRQAKAQKRSIGWKTLYITGRSEFDQIVLDYLKKLEIDFMTGSFNEEGLYLLWVAENFDLKLLKRAIGGKVIFRYRLRFFFNVNSFVTSIDKGKRRHHFTPDQEQMFRNLS